MNNYDKNPHRGVPIGFTKEINLSGLPKFTEKRTAKYIYIAVIFIIVISLAIILAVIIGKNRKKDMDIGTENVVEITDISAEEITEDYQLEMEESDGMIEEENDLSVVRKVTVGNSDIGTVEIPEDYYQTQLSIYGLSDIDTMYSYMSLDGKDKVILLKLGKFTDLATDADFIASKFLSEYEIMLDEERCIYYATGKSASTRGDVIIAIGSLDKMIRVLAIYGEEDIFSVEETYQLEQGFYLPSASPYQEIPEGKKAVGNDEVGYLLIGEDFEETGTETNMEWIRGSEKITLISFRDTAQDYLPLNEFAEIMQERYLGEVGEFSKGDWFKGALYSKREGEEDILEMYVFKGKDGINRLLLISSPNQDSEASLSYQTYLLPIGIETEE